MGKIYALTLVLVFLISFSINVDARNATFSLGHKYLSITYNVNSFIFGVGIGFTADEIPSYISFENYPYEWWENRGQRNKGNDIELFTGKSFRINNFLSSKFAAGVAMQDKVDLYWSNATYWYWGRESIQCRFTLQGNIEYKLSDKYNITIGYHNLYGLIGGLRFSY